jgi:hypothetical protein
LAAWTFIAQLSLMNTLLLHYGRAPEGDAQLRILASQQLYEFHVVNHFAGPLFVVVIGTAGWLGPPSWRTRCPNGFVTGRWPVAACSWYRSARLSSPPLALPVPVGRCTRPG